MKQFIILCLLAFLSTSAFAQSSVWKVSNGQNEIYLAGSVHLLKASDYPLPTQFDQAFESADKVVFETDIAKLNDPQMAQVIMSKAMLPENKTLKDVLSEEVYQNLEAETKEMSVPLASLSRFKPSMVIVTMSGIQMQKIGINAEGVDQHFYNKSKDAGKELGFLESVEHQLDVLMSMGEGNENAFVNYSLEDLDNMESSLNELIASWREGSSELMSTQLAEMEDEYPEIYQSLMVDRNNSWMPQIEDFLKDEKVEYVVVGSLHLHGSDGLLDMLKAKGYSIEQLN